MINRLRWHLHEIDSEWEPKARSLDRRRTYDTVQQHLRDVPGLVARLARNLLDRMRLLTAEIDQIEKELSPNG